MTEENKHDHNITILGQKYCLKSTLAADQIEALAETVQELIQTIKGNDANLSDQSAAVIAALNLAEQIVGSSATEEDEVTQAWFLFVASQHHSG